MCVVSMVMDHYYDKWQPRKTNPLEPGLPGVQPAPPIQIVPLITKEEVEEFRRLLERAREYDRKMNQPDCELDEKRQKLKELAKELGVEIEFV